MKRGFAIVGFMLVIVGLYGMFHRRPLSKTATSKLATSLIPYDAFEDERGGQAVNSDVPKVPLTISAIYPREVKTEESFVVQVVIEAPTKKEFTEIVLSSMTFTLSATGLDVKPESSVSPAVVGTKHIA